MIRRGDYLVDLHGQHEHQALLAVQRHLDMLDAWGGREFAALKNAEIVVVLGKIAFDAYLNFLKSDGKLKNKAGFTFAHGAQYALPNGKTLLCSFHPSLQNTNTGKLTEKMMVDVFKTARKLAELQKRA